MVNVLELLQNNIELFTLNGECLELFQNDMKSNFISVRTFKPKILQIESVLMYLFQKPVSKCIGTRSGTGKLDVLDKCYYLMVRVEIVGSRG